MKQAFFKSIILLSILVFTFENQTIAQQKAGEIKTLEASKFHKKLLKTIDPQLIDVRTPAEFAEAHLHGAANYNVEDSTLQLHISSLNHKKPVFVYCGSGIRSLKAAQILMEQGFKVYNLKGGLKGWKEKKFPLVQE